MADVCFRGDRGWAHMKARIVACVPVARRGARLGHKGRLAHEIEAVGRLPPRAHAAGAQV